MSGTAEYFREAREQKGLTLQQVEEATRIPRYYLEILEGSGNERLVSDRLYMVHFLRSYAAFLEIEEETLAAQFVRENRRLEPDELIAPPRRPPWKGISLTVLALLLIIGIGVVIREPALLDLSLPWNPGTSVEPVAVSTAPVPPEQPAQPLSPAPVAPPRDGGPESSVLQPEANETDPSEPRLVAAVPARIEPVAAPAAEPRPVTQPVTAGRQTEPSATGSGDAVPPSATPDAPALQTASTATEPPGEETAAAAGSTETTAPPATELAALSQSQETGAADPPANHTLTIAAEERSWLRVWVDGEPFRDMLLSPGESRTLSAQAGFVITFGNAGGVRLTLDGEELPPAGESGQVLRGFRLPPKPPASEP